MTREELIKRLSYRDQFDKPIVDNVGLGALLDEAIAMLKADGDLLSKRVRQHDLVVEVIKKRFLQGDSHGKMDGNQ